MKKLTAFILFCLCFLFAKADTFIVTSNADSGPGTLREAITLSNANGMTVADTIVFALTDTSRTGRTINLQTELPALSSNLIIDGTTQRGSKIGVSDARIILYVSSAPPFNFTFLKFTNAGNIEIYGLFLFNGYFSMFSLTNSVINGIDFFNSHNLTFGKPGKGNYFRGLKHAILSNNTSSTQTPTLNSSDITIQSNVFNNNEDGSPGNNYNNGYINFMDFAIRLFECKNIMIGGYGTGEANAICAGEVYIQSHLTTGNGYVKFIKNNAGVNYDGSQPNTGQSTNVKVSIIGGYSGQYASIADYQTEIIGNTINGSIYLYGLTKQFLVQSNKLVYDNSYTMGGNEPKITVNYCSKGGIIGGNVPSLRNEFYSLHCNHYVATWNSLPHGSITVGASPKVLIQQNIMRNNDGYGSSIYVNNTYYAPVPYIRIDSTGVNFVRGKATPDSKIEVFLDDLCQACDGEVFLGETQSNQDSTWSFSGSFSGTVIATATKDSTTSGYSEPTWMTSAFVIKQPTCGQSNGSVSGISPSGSWNKTEWHRWYFTSNSTVVDTVFSTTPDLRNAPPGYYYFISKLGGTCQSPALEVTLRDYTPKIDTTALTLKQPSCGLFNGIISGIKIIDGDYSKVKWVNEQGVVFNGSQSGQFVSLTNLPAGRYKLIVTDTAAGCGDSTRFYTLINQSGPSLNTNSLQITPATCGNKNGSITGITASNVSGTPFIRWVDSLNNIVGSSYDLQNVSPGKYRLKFKDAGGCDTIITSYYIVGNNGAITIDTANKIIAPAKCSGNTGSIQNIAITGGNNYQWKNITTGAIVGNSLSIFNLPAGNYQLTVTSSYGCTKTSPVITVSQTSFLPLTMRQLTTRPSDCGKQNGYINAAFLQDTSGYTFRWVDSSTNQMAGVFTLLSNLYNGMYILFAKDSNGCEQQITKATVTTLPLPSFDYSSMQVIADKCLSGAGGITGLVVKNMQGGSGTYAWLDTANNTFGNAINIQNLQQGNYQLKATDALGCTVLSQPIIVSNINYNLPNPQYDDQTILKNNTAILKLKNYQAGTYQLFADAFATTLLQQNATGNFTTPVLAADKTVYVRYVSGACSSELVPVKITVIDKTAIYVPTAFTPNGDGRNDVLKPIAYGKIKLVYFTVYNRWGEVVFSTSNFSKGWNGTVNGQPADTGVFVWTIKAVDEISGSTIEQKGTVTIIR